MTRHYWSLLRNKLRGQLSRERWSEPLIQADHRALPGCRWPLTTVRERCVFKSLSYRSSACVRKPEQSWRNLWSRGIRHVQALWELAGLPVERFNTFIEGRRIYLYIKGMYIRSFSAYFLDVNVDVFPGCTMKYGVLWTQEKCAHDFHIAVMSPI